MHTPFPFFTGDVISTSGGGGVWRCLCLIPVYVFSGVCNNQSTGESKVYLFSYFYI